MKIIIIGSSGFSKVVIDIVECEAKHEIVGLIDRFREPGESTLGYKVLGGETDVPKIMSDMGIGGALIAIGDNATRKSVYSNLSQACPKLLFPSVIHPSAQLARAVAIESGAVVAALVNIHNSVSVGKFAIINGNTFLGHDVHAGDFSSIGPAAVIGGDVSIGDLSVVAMGARVLEKRKIGCDSIIGAGSTVTKDISEGVIAYGTPAKVIRTRVSGEKYLT